MQPRRGRLRWSERSRLIGAAIATAVFMIAAAAITTLVGYGPRSKVSPSPTPGASSMVTTPPGDCTLPPGSGAISTGPLGDNFHMVVQVPNGWTREPAGASETQLLVVDAPLSYGNRRTTIAVLALIGYFPQQSPRDIAPAYYAPSVHPDVPSSQLVGAVTDCQVEGDPAAAFHYVRGDSSGYLVLFLHFNYLYGVRVEGVGGVNPQAIRDAQQVLGSIQWTVTTPPVR